MRKLINVDGTVRPKGKPRGDPSAIVQYQFKKGDNSIQKQSHRSKRLVSIEVQNELNRIEANRSQAREVARGLVQRAKKDSSELRLVMDITEPGKLQTSTAGAGFFAAAQGQQVAMVMGKLFREEE